MTPNFVLTFDPCMNSAAALFFWFVSFRMSSNKHPLSFMSPLPHSPGKPCQHLLFQLCTLMFLSWPSIDQRTGTQRCVIQANHISHVSPWVCRYAESIGATHFVTSAKLNTGIDEVFLDVARRKCSSHNFALCAIYTLWGVYSCSDFTDYYVWWLKRMSFPPFLQDICCVFFSYVAIVICVSVSLVFSWVQRCSYHGLFVCDRCPRAKKVSWSWTGNSWCTKKECDHRRQAANRFSSSIKVLLLIWPPQWMCVHVNLLIFYLSYLL